MANATLHVVVARDPEHADAAARTLRALDLLDRLRIVVVRDQIERCLVLLDKPLVERELGVRQRFSHTIDGGFLAAAMPRQQRAVFETQFGPRPDAVHAVEMPTEQHAKLFVSWVNFVKKQIQSVIVLSIWWLADSLFV